MVIGRSPLSVLKKTHRRPLLRQADFIIVYLFTFSLQTRFIFRRTCSISVSESLLLTTVTFSLQQKYVYEFKLTFPCAHKSLDVCF